jgi:hypothetical protein
MLKILIVKAESFQRDLTTLETRFKELARFRHAGDLDTALDYLDRGDVSCILLQSGLTDVNGQKLHGVLREKHPRVPVGLLVGEDGLTQLVGMDGMDFHIHHGTPDTEVFRMVVATVEKHGPRLSVPITDLLTQGRLGPDATTKPPRNPSLPIDIVDAASSFGDTEEPIDDLPSRVRALEEKVDAFARELRLATFMVAVVVMLCIVFMLRH